MTLGGRYDGGSGESWKGVMRGRYNQEILYTCPKISKNKNKSLNFGLNKSDLNTVTCMFRLNTLECRVFYLCGTQYQIQFLK